MERLKQFIVFCEINGLMTTDTVRLSMAGFGAEGHIDIELGELKNALK